MNTELASGTTLSATCARNELAAALAVALGARTLVLLSDTPGVRIGGPIVPSLSLAELDGALRHPDVREGMVAKLRGARAALEQGVARVSIAAWTGPGTLRALLAGSGGGTTLVAETRLEVAHG